MSKKKQEQKDIILYIVSGIVAFGGVLAFLSDIKDTVVNMDISQTLIGGEIEKEKDVFQSINAGVSEITPFLKEAKNGSNKNEESGIGEIMTIQKVNEEGIFGTMATMDGAVQLDLIGVTMTSACYTAIGKQLQQGDTLKIIPLSKSNTSVRGYAYFADGTMVQKWLLTNGFVDMKEDIDNLYVNDFQEWKATAQKDKKGIWKPQKQK